MRAPFRQSKKRAPSINKEQFVILPPATYELCATRTPTYDFNTPTIQQQSKMEWNGVPEKRHRMEQWLRITYRV